MTLEIPIAICWIWTVVLVSCNEAETGKSLRHQHQAASTPTCDSEYTERQGWCYYNSANDNLIASYDDAVHTCRLEGGDLVSIHNKSEDEFLRAFAHGSKIGLRYYGDDVFAWSDNTPIDYFNINEAFEANVGYFGYCAQMGSSTWDNMECDEGPFVCKKKPTLYPNTVCPNPSQTYLDNGTVHSPGFPLRYHGSGTQCKYTLAAKNSHLLEIYFSEIQLGNNDTISTYDGANENELIKTLDASSNGMESLSWTIQSNRMLITFDTQKGSAGRWKGIFRTRPLHATTVCPDPDDPYVGEGQVHSPGYPSEYSGILTCYYKLLVEDGYLPEITFRNLALDSEGAYPGYDIIDIFEGFTDDTTAQLGSITHSDNGKQLQFKSTSQNKMMIRFTTLADNSHGLWEAYFSSTSKSPTK